MGGPTPRPPERRMSLDGVGVGWGWGGTEQCVAAPGLTYDITQRIKQLAGSMSHLTAQPIEDDCTNVKRERPNGEDDSNVQR